MENTANINEEIIDPPKGSEEFTTQPAPPSEDVSRETSNNPPPPKKYRYFTMLLYPDNVRHLQVIVDIRSGKYPDATAILHNRDSLEREDDELSPISVSVSRETNTQITEIEFGYKKAHVHVVYKAPYQALKSWMERKFPDIESNLIKGVNEPTAIYRYLIHQDDPQKTQYSPNEVFGCTERFYQYYNASGSLDEFIAVPMILDILDNWDWHQGKPTYSKIIRICCEQGLYGHLRAGGTLLNSAIRECIQEYAAMFEDEQWLNAQYRERLAVEENERLTVALRRATSEISKWRKIAGYEQ